VTGDAIVIGGGVMGLAAARGLRQRGHAVTLLERGQPGRAASWASAGIVGATVRDESDPSYQLRQVSRRLWPAFAQALTDESGLDSEYREMGVVQLATDEVELAHLRRAAQRGSAQRGAAQRESAQPGSAQRESDGDERPQLQDDRLELLDERQLHALEPALSRDLRGGLLMAGGNVENRRLSRALEIAARRAGVRVETSVEVRSVITDNTRVTGVQTADETFEADLVVLAAGAWSATIDGVRPRPPVAPQRGQILAIDQSSVGIRHVLMTSEDPYFVPRADGRLVIGATREEAGWDPSLTTGGVAWLLNRAMQVVPALSACPIAELWTGFRPLSADGLPLIGKGALEGLYFLTGHGPSGIAPLPGSIALLLALIAGEEPPMTPKPFDPMRWSGSATTR
jgi:glycine oxidase